MNDARVELYSNCSKITVLIGQVRYINIVTCLRGGVFFMSKSLLGNHLLGILVYSTTTTTAAIATASTTTTATATTFASVTVTTTWELKDKG